MVLSLAATGPGCGGSNTTPPTVAATDTLREGTLAAGTYEVAFGPGVVFTLGSGWSSHHPGPGFFDVHRPSPEGPAPGTPGWEVALLFLTPQATDAEELVRDIRANGLQIEEQAATTLGGLEATRIDVAATRDDAELMQFEGGSVGGFPGRRYRIWALAEDDGLLTVILDAPASGSPDVQLAEQVLASIRFHGV